MPGEVDNRRTRRRGFLLVRSRAALKERAKLCRVGCITFSTIIVVWVGLQIPVNGFHIGNSVVIIGDVILYFWCQSVSVLYLY